MEVRAEQKLAMMTGIAGHGPPPKYGNCSEPYAVILVQHDGNATIYHFYL